MTKERRIKKIYDDKVFIGKILKTARQKAGLTQAQLSELVDLSDKNIGNIENGSQFPQVNNFLRLIEVLNLSVNDFGVEKTSQFDEIKSELLKKVYSGSQTEMKKYLKALNFVDEIAKIK